MINSVPQKCKAFCGTLNLFCFLWLDSKQRPESGNVSPNLIGQYAQCGGANSHQQVIECNIVAALSDDVGGIQQYSLMH